MGIDDVVRKAGETIGVDDLGARFDKAEAGALRKLVEGKEGLKDLVDRFDAAGLGDKVRSWVGTGENKPVTTEEVKAAVGPDEVKAMAQDAGQDEAGFLDKLTAALPQVVDKLTPDGGVPSVDEVKARVSKLLK